MKIEFSFILFLFLCPAKGRKIKSYFMNKEADLRKNFASENGRECLHTTRETIPLPQEITICYRQKAYITRGNNVRGNGPKSGILSFGNINSGWTDFDSGFVFGIWYSGAWLAYLEKGNPTSWINMGSHFIDMHAWRHTCITLNFKDGKYSNFENGMKHYEKTFDRMPEIGRKFNNTINIFTLGCAYVTEKYVYCILTMSFISNVNSLF